MNHYFVSIDLTVLQVLVLVLVLVLVQVLRTSEQMIIARSDVRAIGRMMEGWGITSQPREPMTQSP